MSTETRTEYLTGDCLLPQVADLHAHLMSVVSSGQVSSLDLSGVGAVDTSFVQVIVSSAVTAGRRGRPLALVGLSPALRGTFERAGIGIDPVHGHIQHQ